MRALVLVPGQQPVLGGDAVVAAWLLLLFNHEWTLMDTNGWCLILLLD